MSDPIDRIKWVPAASLRANGYNPNRVLRDELKLLKFSLLSTGWIQPILVNTTGVIIDGFHRWSLSTLDEEVIARWGGLVPTAQLELDDAAAMAMTVRINRAKGVHIAVKMHDLIRQLIDEHGWSPERVAVEIGGDLEEVDLLYRDGVFAIKGTAKWAYSESWVPAETTRAGIDEFGIVDGDPDLEPVMGGMQQDDVPPIVPRAEAAGPSVPMPEITDDTLVLERYGRLAAQPGARIIAVNVPYSQLPKTWLTHARKENVSPDDGPNHLWFMLCRADGETMIPSGMAALWMRSKTHWRIKGVFVAPEHRGFGVGAAWTRLATAFVDEQGIPFVEAFAANPQHYEDLGFVCTRAKTARQGPVMTLQLS